MWWEISSSVCKEELDGDSASKSSDQEESYKLDLCSCRPLEEQTPPRMTDRECSKEQ